MGKILISPNLSGSADSLGLRNPIIWSRPKTEPKPQESHAVAMTDTIQLGFSNSEWREIKIGRSRSSSLR